MEGIRWLSKSNCFGGEMDRKRCGALAKPLIRDISIFPYGSKLICNFNLCFIIISQVEKVHAYLKYIVSSADWVALIYFLR